MKKVYGIIFGVTIVFMVGAIGIGLAQESLAEGSTEKQQVDVNWHPQSGKGSVNDARANIVRNDNGVSFSFHARELKPGHVYTLWFVVVNSPKKCAKYPEPCTGSDDVIGNTQGVQADVTFANGIVAGDSGKETISGRILEGELPNPWFGYGFEDAGAAEIHLVVNDHGPKVAAIEEDMMHSYRGGCTDESLPPSFPDKAKSDGPPGPNTCRLYQTAIFQPTE